MKQGYVIELESGFYSKNGVTNLSNADFFKSEEDVNFYVDVLNQMGVEVIDVSHAMLKKEHLNRRVKNVRFGVN